MTLRLAFRLLLPLLAAISLALSPVTASAAAAGMRVPAVMQDHAMPTMSGDMDGMAAAMDDMPCCPQDDQAAPDCSKGCPLMALCLAKVASNLPTGGGLPVRVAIIEGPTWAEPRGLDSLAWGPSPEPPRA